MTNLEGRVILRERAITSPAGVTDLEILSELAERLESPAKFAVDARGVRRVGACLAGGRADYSGITYARIREEFGVFWPCPSTGPSTGPRRVPRRTRSTPARRGSSRMASQPRTGGPRSSRSSTEGRPKRHARISRCT